MARPLPCDNQDQNEASFLITNLRTGEVVSLCDACYAGFVTAMAEALAPGPLEGAPGELEAAAEAAGEGEAGRNPARPKRRRQRPQKGSQALASEASPFPDAAPVNE